MRKFADVVSFLFGPLFSLLPIPFVLVSKSTQDYGYALKWTVISYSFVILVVIFISAGVLFGVFSNFDVSKRRQRPLLFSFSAFVIFCYLLTIVIFDGPKILYLGLLAVVLGLISIVIINQRIKASIHLASTTSVVLFLGIVYKGYFFLLLSIIPFLMWARVAAKEHTIKETIVGSILGIVITLVVYFVSKEFFSGMIYN